MGRMRSWGALTIVGLTVIVSVGIMVFILGQQPQIPVPKPPTPPVQDAPELTPTQLAQPTPTSQLAPPTPESTQPTATPAAQPTSPPVVTTAAGGELIIVTPVPRPQTVFEAATLVAQVTADAATTGTTTPTPPNLVTATFTPTPIVVTKTPVPANASTAEYIAAMETAVVATTGTPVPRLGEVLIATDTPPPPPKPSPTPVSAPTQRPTVTPTPVMIPLEVLALTPTPAAPPTPSFPPELLGKILFISNMRGKIEAFAVNPDGTGAALLTSKLPYDYAAMRDTYSANNSMRAFSEREIDGNYLVQVFMLDLTYSAKLQLTKFGSGTAWSPAWSPTDDVVALVSSESGNDEIWAVRKEEWPAQQLTKNTWEWDKHPSWSPDGKQIIFSSNRSGKQQIWIMNADGSDQRPVTDYAYDAWDPVWAKYPE